MCAGWRILWELVLSFHRVGPRVGNQITSFGSKYLYPLRHLKSQSWHFYLAYGSPPEPEVLSWKTAAVATSFRQALLPGFTGFGDKSQPWLPDDSVVSALLIPTGSAGRGSAQKYGDSEL